MKALFLTRMVLIAVACLAVTAGQAWADVITFDGLAPDNLAHPEWGGTVPENYGSTDLVTVNFSSTADRIYKQYGAAPYVYWWPTYGDLSNVAYSANPAGTLLVSFTPAAGYQITLNSFHLGQDVDSSNGVPRLDVLPFYISDTSGSGFVFRFTQTNELIHSYFAPNYTTSGTLTLAVASNWHVGIDDIEFTASRIPTPPPPQGVPEPASLAMLASGAVALAIRRRK